MMKSYRCAAMFVAFLGSAPFVTSSESSGDSWARLIVPIGHGPAPGVPFTIRDFRFVDATLSAEGWYCYTQGRDPVVLHGKKEANPPFFRPVVTYEVGVEDKAKWKRLDAGTEQARSDTATVNPDNPMVNITINMEPLRGWIGTYRYGRVVLENGDAAVVALEDLLPTARARDGHGNFKEDVIGGDAGGMLKHGFKPPRPNDPAVLSNVISLGGQLIGEFLVDTQGKTVTLKGTRTLDGDFWPTATFEVGNSEKDWKEIGKSKNNGTSATLEISEGKAETVRFLLGDYKSLISQYKFGKIVFSNGESTVFYLDLLEPKT
jgi:hypothetical protein